MLFQVSFIFSINPSLAFTWRSGRPIIFPMRPCIRRARATPAAKFSSNSSFDSPAASTTGSILHWPGSRSLATQHDPVGNEYHVLSIPHDNAGARSVVGCIIDDDDHVYIPQGTSLVSRTFNRWDMVAGDFVPRVLLVVSGSEVVYQTEYGLGTVFRATGTSISSLVLDTGGPGHGEVPYLVSITIYMVDGTTGKPDLNMPIFKKNVRGEFYALDQTNGMTLVDANVQGLEPGREYFLALEGFSGPVDGETTVPVRITAGTSRTAGYAGGSLWVKNATANATTGTGQWIEVPSSDLVFFTDWYHPALLASVQLWDPVMSCWFDWLPVEIGYNGMFGFQVGTATEVTWEGGSAVVRAVDETYLPPGAWRARVHFSGNEWYEPASKEFDIFIDAAPTELVYLPDASIQRDFADRGTNMTAREYQTSEFRDEAGKPWTYLELSRTYGDDTSFGFKLVTKDTRLPIANAPVFLQVGIVPGSITWNDDYFADATQEYLYLQQPGVNDQVPLAYQMLYYQGKYDIPIKYPYFDVNLTTWQFWGPLMWTVKRTDASGVVIFGNARDDGSVAYEDGIPIKTFLEDVYAVLKDTADLSSIKLYIRAFYKNDVTFESMAIEPSNTRFCNGPDVQDMLFTVDDPARPGYTGSYRNHYLGNCYAEGHVRVSREDIEIASSTVEGTITDDRGFEINLFLCEANRNANGKLVLEPWRSDSAGWFDDIAATGQEEYMELEIVSPAGTLFTGVPLLAIINETGIATFEISLATMGESFVRLYPGIYIGRAAFHGTDYMKPAPADGTKHEFQIVVASAQTWNASAPPFWYDLEYSFDRDAHAYHAPGDPDRCVVNITFPGGNYLYHGEHVSFTIAGTSTVTAWFSLGGGAVPSSTHVLAADDVVQVNASSMDSAFILANKTRMALQSRVPPRTGMTVTPNGTLTINFPCAVEVMSFNSTGNGPGTVNVTSGGVHVPGSMPAWEPDVPRLRGEVVVLEDDLGVADVDASNGNWVEDVEELDPSIDGIDFSLVYRRLNNDKEDWFTNDTAYQNQKEWEIITAIASNPNTPEEIRARLSIDFLARRNKHKIIIS